jgi:hypothetical protein
MAKHPYIKQEANNILDASLYIFKNYLDVMLKLKLELMTLLLEFQNQECRITETY